MTPVSVHWQCPRQCPRHLTVRSTGVQPATSCRLGLTSGLSWVSFACALGHVLSAGGLPRVVAQAQTGTNPPAAVLARVDDDKGIVFFGSGMTPAAGPEVRVNSTKPFAPQPIVMLTAASPNAAGLDLFVATNATGFLINASLAASGHQIQYWVVG